MVLGLGRILITQNNEEIMQSRLLQLGLSRQRPCNLVVVGDGGQRTQGTKAADTEPAEFYAQFFIHAVSVASEELKQHIYSTVCNKSHLVSLEKLTQMLLILLSTVLKSGKTHSYDSICFEISQVTSSKVFVPMSISSGLIRSGRVRSGQVRSGQVSHGQIKQGS